MDKLLTVAGVAEIFDVSTDYVYDLVHAELLECVRIPSPTGNRKRDQIRFEPGHVEAALAKWRKAGAGLVSPIGRAA